jgi:hypothetical protein
MRGKLCYRVLHDVDDWLVSPSVGRHSTRRDCLLASTLISRLLKYYGLQRYPLKGMGRRDDMYRPPGICYRYGAVHIRDSRSQGPKSGVYGEVDDELCEEGQTERAGTVGLEFRRSVRFPEFGRPGRSFLLTASARLSLGVKGYLFLPSAPLTSSYPGGEALVEVGQGQAMLSYLAAPGGSGVDSPHRLFDGGMGGNSSGR